MPKIIITRDRIYQIDQELQSMQKESPALALLLSDKIEKFYQNAGEELKITKARFLTILRQHAELDENSEPVIHEVNGTSKYKFKPSMVQEHNDFIILGADKVEEEFNNRAKKLMLQPITLTW